SNEESRCHGNRLRGRRESNQFGAAAYYANMAVTHDMMGWLSRTLLLAIPLRVPWDSNRKQPACLFHSRWKRAATLPGHRHESGRRNNNRRGKATWKTDSE